MSECARSPFREISPTAGGPPFRKVSVIALGCKVSQYDGQVLREFLKEGGSETRIGFEPGQELFVVNACAVTNEAVRQARQMIRRLARRTPKPWIVISGCWPQVAPEEVVAIEGVDLVVGQLPRDEILDYLRAGARGTRVRPLRDDLEFEEHPISSFQGHSRAFVKIQDGCDRLCSYCIVPLARGRSRSRRVDDVVEEVTRLVHRGKNEVVLTGTCLGDYSRGDVNLSQLLSLLREIPDLLRIRLSSLEPTDFDHPLINALAAGGKLCPHVHIPLQSGDRDILSRMNRPYGPEFYADLVLDLKERIPNLGIGADVMVGFPGETSEQFERTLGLIRSLPLAYLHVFAFSPRPGTRAESFADRVAPREAHRRSRTLITVGKEKSSAFRRASLGIDMEVLVEGKRDRGTGLLVGLTGNYLRILFEGGENLMGRMVAVRVEGERGERLWGRVL